VIQPGETLPKGASLVGVWSGSLVGAFSTLSTPISFTVPLKTAPQQVVVKSGEDKSASGCPKPTEWDSAGTPEAAEGKLCVYEGVGPGGVGSGTIIAQVATPTTAGSGLVVTCLVPSEEFCNWRGVWAVTAS
jgi:hypothetical protein